MIENIGKTLILWIAIIVATVIGVIVWLQNSLLFYPNTSIFNWSPDDREIIDATTTSSTTSTSTSRSLDTPQNTIPQPIMQINARSRPIDENAIVSEQDIMIPDKFGGISAYYVNNFEGKDFLLYCHGTSGNIADRKYVYDICQEHQLNFLVFDYHGYGKSPRFPTVEGILKDGLTAYDFLTQKKGIPPNKIIPWGESLGGAVAAYIARFREVKGVVLMATFSSMPSLLNNMDSFGWIRFPLSLISRITLHPLDTARWVKTAHAPVVVMHSKEDNYIAYDCGIENYTFAKEPKKLITIGGKHISPEITFEQIKEALDFIEEHKAI